MLNPRTEIGSSIPQSMKAAPPFGGGHGGASPVNHIPEKSGLPSLVRGVGADRLGFPSGVRGTPAVGYFSHWADNGVEMPTTPATKKASKAAETNRRTMGSP